MIEMIYESGCQLHILIQQLANEWMNLFVVHTCCCYRFSKLGKTWIRILQERFSESIVDVCLFKNILNIVTVLRTVRVDVHCICVRC